MLQPIDMPFREVSQAPDIASLHQCKKMKRIQGLTIPVEIWQEKKSLGRVAVPENNIFLFRTAFEDIEDPVQLASGSKRLEIRKSVVGIYGRRFIDHTKPRGRVLLDVRFGTRVNDIDLQGR